MCVPGCVRACAWMCVCVCAGFLSGEWGWVGVRSMVKIIIKEELYSSDL